MLAAPATQERAGGLGSGLTSGVGDFGRLDSQAMITKAHLDTEAGLLLNIWDFESEFAS